MTFFMAVALPPPPMTFFRASVALPPQKKYAPDSVFVL